MVMCFTEAIHAIWIPLNTLVFGGQCKTPSQLCKVFLEFLADVGMMLDLCYMVAD